MGLLKGETERALYFTGRGYDRIRAIVPSAEAVNQTMLHRI
ncbi:hypothetical protein [Microcoleus sp. LEGE 07076]|nr:hypothetical protein [Microcoleus sp. LEGE 07076]